MKTETITGSVIYDKDKGRKRFVPKSADHLQLVINRLPTNTKLALRFDEYKASRSTEQLRYHWVLLGLLSDHTGYLKEELHDFQMRSVFGEKEIELAGKAFKVRESIADHAKFPKHRMVELIASDIELCADLGIVVPTLHELGYYKGDWVSEYTKPPEGGDVLGKSHRSGI